MDQLIAHVDSIILSFVQGSFGSLTTAVQTLWRLMFIVFIAIYGYKVIISGRFSVSELMVSCVKIIVLLVLATQWGAFFQFIYRMATDLPSDIAGQIMAAASNSLGAAAQASSTTTANSALGQFYDRVQTVVAHLLEGAGWNHIGPYFYAFVVWLGGICFTGYAAVLILIAKLMVALMLAVGPLVILLLMFKDTRQLFEGWLRTLLNYALMPVFVYTLLALLLSIAEPTLRYLENNTAVYDQLITAIGPFLITMFISTLLLKQILNVSASVTGGMSLSSMGGFGGLVTGLRYFGEGSTLTSANAWKGAKAAKAYLNKRKASRDALQQSLAKNREGA